MKSLNEYINEKLSTKHHRVLRSVDKKRMLEFISQTADTEDFNRVIIDVLCDYSKYNRIDIEEISQEIAEKLNININSFLNRI